MKTLKKPGIVGARLLFPYKWNIQNKTPRDRFDDVAAVRLADFSCPTVLTDGEKYFQVGGSPDGDAACSGLWGIEFL